jgi:putative membrane protein
LFIAAMLVWHLPVLYDAALQNTSVHLFEHICFLITGMLFWWVIIQPFPGPRRFAAGWRLAFVLAAMVPDTALGMLFILSGSPIYPYYAALPRLWGISVMDDQGLGGNIMMVGGDAILVITLIPLFASMMNRLEQRELASWAAAESAEL